VGDDDEATILTGELAILRHDEVYEQVLDFLAANAAG
jgi:hypothetical protein